MKVKELKISYKNFNKRKEYINIIWSRLQRKLLKIEEINNEKSLNSPKDRNSECMYTKRQISKICEAKTDQTERRKRHIIVIVRDMNTTVSAIHGIKRISTKIEELNQ